VPRGRREPGRGPQQRPRPRETAGIDETRRDQFGEAVLHLAAQQARPLDDLVEERSAMLAYMVEYGLGVAARLTRARLGGDGGPEAHVAAGEERERGRAHRHPTPPGAVRPRPQPRPGGAAAEATLVEPGRLIALEARRKDLALPRRRRRFETLDLPDQRVERLRAFHARIGAHVLPGEQKAQEIAGRHRLDLGP